MYERFFYKKHFERKRRADACYDQNKYLIK
jgi:hypothetical protein